MTRDIQDTLAGLGLREVKARLGVGPFGGDRAAEGNVVYEEGEESGFARHGSLGIVEFAGLVAGRRPRRPAPTSPAAEAV